MDWTKPLSTVLVLLVIVWSAGAAVELFATTFSIGPNVTAAAAVLAFVALVILVMIAVGARNRRWLDNPSSYW
jgi:hypothetical protein